MSLKFLVFKKQGLILARLLGLRLNLDSIKVGSIFPLTLKAKMRDSQLMLETLSFFFFFSNNNNIFVSNCIPNLIKTF